MINEIRQINLERLAYKQCSSVLEIIYEQKLDVLNIIMTLENYTILKLLHTKYSINFTYKKSNDSD